MKFLVIRFSSIGDVTQALSLPAHIQNTYQNATVDFLTKEEFKNLLAPSPYIHQVWTIKKNMGFVQLVQLAHKISKNNYTHVYDSHNNLRSNLFYFLISAPNKLQRPMMRFKRFLLLNFNKNFFEKPFSGQRDLLKPLEKWNIPFALPAAPQLFITIDDQFNADLIIQQHGLKNFIVLVPSAAHLLKRWPISHWQKLIELNNDKTFIILAGPNDDFTKIFNKYAHVVNLTGLTNLIQSAALIQKSDLVITNDTGMLHFAEQLGKPAIALMGPAPFGFPSRPTTKILERQLKCRPCSKHGQGPCTNPNYQECLTSITPDEVNRELQKLC